MSKLPIIPIETAKRNRLICFLAFMLVDFITPMIIIGCKFKLFTEFSGYKLTCVGVFALVILIFKFRGKLIDFVNKWEYSILKYIILGLNKCLFFIAISILLHLAVNGVEDIVFCVDWILVCSLIAYLVIQPLEEKYDAIVKRELRKTEMREVLQENNLK